MEYPVSHRPSKTLRAAVFVLFAGLALVFLAGWREQTLLARHPWHALLVAIEDEQVPEEAVSLRARHLPETNLSAERRLLVEQLRAQAGGEEAIEIFGLSHMEQLVMVDTDAAFFTPALASGRLPEPGRPEVLAGALTRFDTFEIDDTEFTVVGRLDPLIPGVLTAYFLPAHPTFDAIFTGQHDVTTGWMDVNGLDRLDEFEIEETSGEVASRFLLPFGRVPTPVTAAAILGLLGVAAGGAMLQIHLLRHLAPRSGPFFRPFLSELTTRPGLLLAMHVLLYGVLFTGMAVGTLAPRMTYNAMRFTQTIFSEGDLGYIGRAYQSGNIPMAALATLNQNYFLGTCLYTVLPSLFIPFAGVLKNLASFSFVGWVMTPLWTGTVAQNTYHSITMTLELEAYVLVSFAISVLPIRAARGFRDGAWAAHYAAGLRTIASAVFLTGILLAIAALYEATSLILLR
ncbi:MAG: hypothetical protein U9Q79_01685 [Candidatus Hydrogenedentes bacterium]|nr:hypothetical protein [Candidatus Hydrogenedentota bacterium]